MTPVYDPEAVEPMRRELEEVGFRSLTTPADVDAAVDPNASGTTLIVINSVCGCAAGSCRPGVARALQHRVIPDRLLTVFAGVDMEATQRVRAYLHEYPASSPNVALLKDGVPVVVMQRQEIELLTAEGLAGRLVEAFERHCAAAGPSVPPEVYARRCTAEQCGSSIPLFSGD